MHPEDVEYTALRTEIIHYDRLCLTILGALLTLSTAVYGLVAEKGIFSLLLLLSVIWSVGFHYIVDKRASILRIALYLQIYFECSNRGFWWESWLRNDGLCLSSCDPKLVDHKGLSLLPTRDPVQIEFFLLLIVLSVNTLWLWMLSAPGAEVDTLISVEAQSLVRLLAIITTIFSLASLVWSSRLLKKYHAFDRKGFVKACLQHKER